jgi:hypothetical protein
MQAVYGSAVGMAANDDEARERALVLLKAAENVNRMVYAITVPPMWLFVPVMVLTPPLMLWFFWLLWTH